VALRMSSPSAAICAFGRAHLVPDGESGVPERVEHRSDERVELGGGAARDDEQVDVRVRKQPAGTVATEREQCERDPDGL